MRVTQLLLLGTAAVILLAGDASAVDNNLRRTVSDKHHNKGKHSLKVDAVAPSVPTLAVPVAAAAAPVVAVPAHFVDYEPHFTRDAALGK